MTNFVTARQLANQVFINIAGEDDERTVCLIENALKRYATQETERRCAELERDNQTLKEIIKHTKEILKAIHECEQRNAKGKK